MSPQASLPSPEAGTVAAHDGRAWARLPASEQGEGDMFDIEMRGEVAVVRMRHGRANTLDTAFCEAIVTQLDALRGTAGAVVWTADGGIFSAGVDLRRLVDGGQAYLHSFVPALSRAFKALYAFPQPLVTAVNGHALAGGCVIAAAGDQRLMVDAGASIGMPELRVGVPFPGIGLEIMRQVAGPAIERLLYRGERLDPGAALAMGLVHELVPAAELLERAVTLAADLASLPAEAFAVTKWQLREQVFLRLQTLEDEEREVERLWLEEATLARVRAYVASTLG